MLLNLQQVAQSLWSIASFNSAANGTNTNSGTLETTDIIPLTRGAGFLQTTLAAVALFVFSQFYSSGPTSGRPTPVIIGQKYMDMTLGFEVTCYQVSPPIWIDGAGVQV